MGKATVQSIIRPLVRPFAEFIRTESFSGVILLISSTLALLLANLDEGVAAYFPAIWESELRFSINEFQLNKTISHWINDGLMALFFLVVGLEIKREILEGELSSIRQAALPLVGALGGMLVPALLYILFNFNTPTAGGWGIPMATDIAFALAVLHLMGDRVPLSLKVFLTALAIADDLGAVLVIALFYTSDLSPGYLAWAGGVWLFLMILNRLNVRLLPVYLLLGLFLWYFTLKSGVHATIAGVLLAMTVPFRIRQSRDELMQMIDERLTVVNETITVGDVKPRDISEELEDINDHISSPAQRLENQLHGPVAYVIIPLFAFCNTSIVIDPAVLNQLFTPMSLGIMAGLIVGKPLGIGLLSWIAIRMGWASMPEGVNWRKLMGVASLAGIGFTMSIFITLLAFADQPQLQSVARLSIVVASLVAGGIGYLLLNQSHEKVVSETAR